MTRLVLLVVGALAGTILMLYSRAAPAPEENGLILKLIWRSAGYLIVLAALWLGADWWRKRQSPQPGMAPAPFATAIVLEMASAGALTVEGGGTVWRAKPVSSGPLRVGERVRVIGREGLLLSVEPMEGTPAEPAPAP